MRKRRVVAAPESIYKCRDCVNAYDLSNKSWCGEFILCRCRLDEDTGYGKYKKLLSSAACEHFKLKD